MVFTPGTPKPEGSGKKKGTPNKVTAQAREAIAQFVDGNASRLVGWLDLIAAKNPKQAFDCFMSVVEYHIPKLARSEVQPLDHDGKPSSGFHILVEHVKADKNSTT